MSMRCDACDESVGYSPANPFVEFRTARPSDLGDMCCVLAGHARCFGVDPKSLPNIGTESGAATREQWLSWIDSPAARERGFVTLG